jgi:hypothetical protein
MRYRKLRIAWSMVCGIATVLLLALWVRSYRDHDAVYCHVAFTDIFGGDSRLGTIRLVSGKLKSQPHFGIYSEHYTSEKMLQLYGSAADPMNEHPNRFGVGFTHPSGYTAFSSPSWLIAMLSAVSAVLPWIQLRFSLRTLLIATTLVAVALGLLVSLR